MNSLYRFGIGGNHTEESAMRVCIAAILLAVSQMALAETAGEMLSKCRPIAEAKTDGQKIAYVRTTDTAMCWGAFATIQGFSRFTDARGKSLLHICAPAKSTRQQFVAVFVEYTKKNHQRWHEDFENLVFDSLVLAFPCR